ncbi:NAD(P)-dependent malic enzyme [Isachenkonia alkalipeptolytica]|uniref:NAD-dependent malic enzyme n=1 Tax=Isachenkonia alkalipeptolytica TaxID=2565777 RepID=A0AA43XMV2_9CLOT|nr:malic enzyme-like NAD(P)-binding protein [Isachenkonia alkalipeptolytica]NBG88850.1 NAD-dependent malic enzyme [Isachenkonia alkalipeptolytica]
MDRKEKAMALHREWKGKIEVTSTVPLETRKDLSLAYTPGVAEPCLEIAKNKEEAYNLTRKWNLVAVVTDGSAVLGLGDIGPEAAMPVMEGKCVLFKNFGNVDGFPICLDTKDPEKIVETIKLMSPTFGGINLEDISAPRCFEIEERLKAELDIPIFHDDQHGTAIVVVAGIINALKLVNKRAEEITVVINGAGAAGTAIAKMVLNLGVTDILLCDRQGILHRESPFTDPSKAEMAKKTNHHKKQGTLKDAMVGADIFIGVSAPEVVTEEMVRSMNKDAIVFAMANPVPEVMPDIAKKGGAKVIGTGRSDFPNQINNVLAFPGVFRGALDVRAKEINEEMKLAAARAIAEVINEEELTETYILPDAFDLRVADHIAKAVARAAINTGVNRLKNTKE